MAGEVASAFVRIRPNMTGFRAETERGARSSFSNIARIAGVAFGAVAAFKLGKDIVSHAADVQKQAEAIGAEFGKAGERVIEFSHTSAAQLGLSAHIAEQTAAKFGILFKNLNVGQDQAAQMTVGFEKLAGSLSLIRNLDPSIVLKNLPLAVAGNLRSLKQLGIATDQTQLKLAAYKLGLISTVKDALTPTTRAQAIYAIATAKLPEYLRQAYSHTHDLATQQRILSAEWDNAKDSLGRGLIPVISRLVGFLAVNLPGAVKKVEASFRDGFKFIHDLTGPIGGVRVAVEALLATFVVSKVIRFANGFRTAFAANTRASAQSILSSREATKAENDATLAAAQHRSAVDELAGAMAPVGAAATKAGEEMGTAFKTSAEEASTSLGAVSTAATRIGTSVEDAVVAGKAALASLVLAAQEEAAALARTAAPILVAPTVVARSAPTAVGEAFAGAGAGASQSMEALAASAASVGVAVTASTDEAVVGLTGLDTAAEDTATVFADVGKSVRDTLATIPVAAAEAAGQAKIEILSIGASFTAMAADAETGIATTQGALAGLRASVVGFASTVKTLLVQTAIFALIVGLTEAYTHSDKFHKKVNDIASDIRGYVVPAFENLKGRLGPVFEKVKEDAKVTFDAIRQGVEKAWPVVSKIASAFQGLTGPMRAAIVLVAGLGIAFLAVDAGVAPLTAIVVAVAAVGVAFKLAYSHSETFRKVVDGAMDAVRSAVKKVPEAIGKIGDAFKGLEKHKTLLEVIGGAAAGAAGAFVALRTAVVLYTAVTKIATAVQTAFDFALAVNPIVLIALAIGALVGAIVVLYVKSQTAHRIIDDAFHGIVDAVKMLDPVFHDVVETAKAVFADLEQIVETVFPIVKKVVENFVATIKTEFTAAVAVAQFIWQHFGGLIIALTKNAFETVIGVVRGALQIVRGVVDLVTGLLTGDWGKAWKGLKEIVSGFLNEIISVAKGFGTELVDIFTALWHTIEKVFLMGIEKVVALLSKIPTSFKVAGVSIGFENPFKGIDKSLKQHIADIGKSAKHAGEVPKTVGDAVAKANKDSRDAIANSVIDVTGRGADSAEAGNLAKEAADATAKAAAENAKSLKSMNDQLQNTVKVQDAGIAKIRGQLKTLGTNLTTSITNETKDVLDAVEQAKGNLASIGSTLSQDISSVLDKPLADAQNKINAFGNRRNLDILRQSILLPGGKQLSTDPKKALAELQQLAKQSGNVNKAAINDFILQYKGAILAVRGDQVNAQKDAATRTISDLTDSFNRGHLTLTQYKKKILDLLAKDHVSYHKAGQLLGTAFANGFKDNVKGLFEQAAAINASPLKFRAATTGAQPSIVKPLDTLHKDQQGIQKIQSQILAKHGALQARIAKAAETQATLMKQLAAVDVGSAATVVGKNPGANTKKVKGLNGTTR